MTQQLSTGQVRLVPPSGMQDAGAIAAWRRRALSHDRVDTSIRIGYFLNEWDVRYHDVIEGNLLRQFDFTYDLLTTKYLKAVISYEGTQRIESFPEPHAAMRETLLNAVVHRDYSQPMETQIRVYRDRMWITNVGHLPKGWSDACHRAGVPAPKISTRPEAFDVEFTFSEKYFTGLGETTQETDQEQTNTTHENGQGSREKMIIGLLRENPTITRRQLADSAGITSDGVKYHLDQLRLRGIIRHVDPTKKGHWEIIDERGE